MRKRKAACFPEFNYTLQWRKVKRRVLHAVLMYNGLLQASCREDAAGSSSQSQSQSQSDSRTAAGTSSSTSESAGTASKTITNTLC